MRALPQAFPLQGPTGTTGHEPGVDGGRLTDGFQSTPSTA